MLKGTSNHMQNLPDLPRYVLVLPICTAKRVRPTFLMREFQKAFPKRYTPFLDKYRAKMCPYRWFDIWRADPYVFEPHILTAGVSRKADEYLQDDVVEDILRGVAEWMGIELPLVKNLFIAMPAKRRECETIKQVAKRLFERDLGLDVHLFARPIFR